MKIFNLKAFTRSGPAGQLSGHLILPLVMIVLSFIGGTLGFYILGSSRWSLLDCIYMTSITLTTVGYGEVLAGMDRPAKILAMVLMWVGMGMVLYAISTITAFVVERNLSKYMRERRMTKKVSSLKDHFIVCGLGPTGLQVLDELYASGRRPVAIDLDQDKIDRASSRFPDLPTLKGDASSEELLRKAGVEKAAGILALLPEDGQNLLITVEANYINPEIKIAARTSKNSLTEKFRRAGADYVVNPSSIGGLRLASVILRPTVVTFLDKMLRSGSPSVRVEEVTIGTGSPLIGKTLKEADIFGLTGLNPVALKPQNSHNFIYNPGSNEILTDAMVIIIIGDRSKIDKLIRLCDR